MIPLTAVLVLATTLILAHRTAAAEALTVDRSVSLVSELTELRDALRDQQTSSEFDVRFIELKVTRTMATSFLGFDPNTGVVPARIRAAHALANLGPRSPVTAASLDSLYARIDGGSLVPADAVAAFNRIVASLEVTVHVQLADVQRRVGHPRLSADIAALQAANDMVDAADPQVVSLSAVWFPSPGVSSGEAVAELTSLARQRANYEQAADVLRRRGAAIVVASLARLSVDPRVVAFDQGVTATLAGKVDTPGSPIDAASIGTAFRGVPTRNDKLDQLVAAATVAVNAEARRVARNERNEYLTWLLMAAAMALFSVVTALRQGRSIARPLKGLASLARKINDGELDVVPDNQRKHEPRETRLVLGVFTDLVSNLQLMDAKANALAQCNFDDPVLSMPLPGRLGRSLESSVALLSGSIVERDELQTHLAYQATHDSLTGISNRPAAITAIEAAMHRAERTGATTAVLFIDLNEFKAINDSHGHEVGDEVLRSVATRLTSTLRRGDFVARLGGDEFVVVSEGVVDVADATDLAHRVIEAVSVPIDVKGLRLAIGAAVGVALSLDGPEEPLRLLARADAAMYRAKAHDRSAIEIFDADLQRQMLEREDIEAALALALADPDGGLSLNYQPVLDAGSGAVTGVEALIRWDRPGHGPLAPDEFIPIAETTALIIDVDRWVLAEATRQLSSWADDADVGTVPVAVNISGRHLLSRQLPGHIREALDTSGIDPYRLTIEITETVLLTDLVSAAAELEAVRAMGVKVAIDDFGTGYTSLAHLQQLPIDTIKIDRSFISQLGVRRGSSLVRMVTDLGHAIDINIVAEGVETDAELTALQGMGADQLQGFLLSRPLTPNALTSWVKTHNQNGQDAFPSVSVPV